MNNIIKPEYDYNLEKKRVFFLIDSKSFYASVDKVTCGNKTATKVGDFVKFNSENNEGRTNKYDTTTNGVGIVFGQYGIIWFYTDAFIKL